MDAFHHHTHTQAKRKIDVWKAEAMSYIDIFAVQLGWCSRSERQMFRRHTFAHHFSLSSRLRFSDDILIHSFLQ